jgi:hypothetical protein
MTSTTPSPLKTIQEGIEVHYPRESKGHKFDHPDFRGRDAFFKFLRESGLTADHIKILQKHWGAVVCIRGRIADQSYDIGTGWLLACPPMAVKDKGRTKSLLPRFPLVVTNRHVFDEVNKCEFYVHHHINIPDLFQVLLSWQFLIMRRIEESWNLS